MTFREGTGAGPIEKYSLLLTPPITFVRLAVEPSPPPSIVWRYWKKYPNDIDAHIEVSLFSQGKPATDDREVYREPTKSTTYRTAF